MSKGTDDIYGESADQIVFHSSLPYLLPFGVGCPAPARSR